MGENTESPESSQAESSILDDILAPPKPSAKFDDVKINDHKNIDDTPKQKRKYTKRNAPKVVDPEVSYRAGQQTAKIIMSMSAAIFPATAPDKNNPDEIAMQTFAIDSTGEYFKSKNFEDVPVGLALVLAWGSYYAMLATKEANRPKVEGFVNKTVTWIKTKYAEWKFKNEQVTENKPNPGL